MKQTQLDKEYKQLKKDLEEFREELHDKTILNSPDYERRNFFFYNNKLYTSMVYILSTFKKQSKLFYKILFNRGLHEFNIYLLHGDYSGDNILYSMPHVQYIISDDKHLFNKNLALEVYLEDRDNISYPTIRIWLDTLNFMKKIETNSFNFEDEYDQSLIKTFFRNLTEEIMLSEKNITFSEMDRMNRIHNLPTAMHTEYSNFFIISEPMHDITTQVEIPYYPVSIEEDIYNKMSFSILLDYCKKTKDDKTIKSNISFLFSKAAAALSLKEIKIAIDDVMQSLDDKYKLAGLSKDTRQCIKNNIETLLDKVPTRCSYSSDLLLATCKKILTEACDLIEMENIEIDPNVLSLVFNS